jgi:hypothetical protein
MSTKGTTASYVELSSKTYSLFVDAYAAANKRGLEYAKSVWGVTSRPYSTAPIEAAVQDNFDRASQIVSLTVAELENNGQKVAEFAEEFAAQAAKFQESYTASLKGLLDTGLSNLTFVKDTAAQQFEDLTKRMDDMQKHAAATVSSTN